MKVIVCLNHELVAEQIEELKRLGYNNIIYLKEVNSSLAERLKETPADEYELTCLATELDRTISGSGADGVVLPVGSPAFMYLLSLRLPANVVLQVLFAHSARVSKEIVRDDGTVEKMSEFRHIRFIRFWVDGELCE